MTTVMICDDDPIVREALGAYLERERDLSIVALVETAGEVLRLLETTAPDVVLMDLALPGMNGIDATLLVRESRPSTAVLVLTTFGSDEQVRAAISAGAAGFLLKSTSPAALAAAVRATKADAGTLIAPQLATQIVADPRRIPAPLTTPGAAAPAVIENLNLTDREVDVLSLLCAAESNAGIARALSLSESTVKSHVSSLMGKLDCVSRLQVALRAFEHGLVNPPRPTGSPGG